MTKALLIAILQGDVAMTAFVVLWQPLIFSGNDTKSIGSSKKSRDCTFCASYLCNYRISDSAFGNL